MKLSRRRAVNFRQRFAGLLLALFVSAVAYADWGLPALMQELAATVRPPVSFTETRESEMLRIPLVSRGTLSLSPAGVMTKETVTPVKTRTVIDDRSIRLYRDDKPGETVELSLQQQPWLYGFVAGFRALLRGDRPTLEQHYTIQLSGSREAWHMTLRPRDSRLQGYILTLEANGSHGEIKRFEINEPLGDTTTLEIGRPLQ